MTVNPISQRICLCDGCNKPARTTKERGTQYCSNECIVKHCRYLHQVFLFCQFALKTLRAFLYKVSQQVSKLALFMPQFLIKCPLCFHEKADWLTCYDLGWSTQDLGKLASGKVYWTREIFDNSTIADTIVWDCCFTIFKR